MGGGAGGTGGGAGAGGLNCAAPSCDVAGKYVIIDHDKKCVVEKNNDESKKVACFSTANGGPCGSLTAGCCYKRTEGGKATYVLNNSEFFQAVVMGTGWEKCDSMNCMVGLPDTSGLPNCP